jgi:hypothetical protein
MPETDNVKHDSPDDVRRRVAAATERAKFKNWRLRKLKERNEAYLSSRRDLDDFEDADALDEDEVTKEL